MEKATMDASGTLQLAELKELGAVDGPCLTIIAPAQRAPNTARQDHLRLKAAAQSAEAALAKHALQEREIEEFLEPVHNLDLESIGGESNKTIVVFRAPQVFRAFFVHEPLNDLSIVAEHFQILPCLKAVQEESLYFFVLALSQKHVRLLRCTNHSSVEVPFGKDTPNNLEDWLNTRTPTSSPDHGSKRPSALGSAGNFTSTHDRDKMDSHIENFFHRIDEAVFEALRGEKAPLILAGVEHETTMYRGLNRYLQLAGRDVHGSPESLKGGELHRRALEIARETFEEPIQKALELFERLGGSERVATKPRDVVQAAATARVSQLFVVDGATQLGSWDKKTLKVKQGGEGEDLLNIAALHTIVNGG
ncbi:MAG TPA: hypothetical protein VEX68_27935, partial [Bryobacteraceae bacterium]|nr:hypothetical protein [Bryobacteraceae bacterium]